MEASLQKCVAFIKISTISEDFIRKIETFSEKLRLFQGLRGFLNTFLVEFFYNVSVVFIKHFAAEAFWPSLPLFRVKLPQV
jgi:hypothetical protein